MRLIRYVLTTRHFGWADFYAWIESQWNYIHASLLETTIHYTKQTNGYKTYNSLVNTILVYTIFKVMKFPNFIKPEGSLQCSQEPAILIFRNMLFFYCEELSPHSAT
jgi:hypothetical protein